MNNHFDNCQIQLLRNNMLTENSLCFNGTSLRCEQRPVRVARLPWLLSDWLPMALFTWCWLAANVAVSQDDSQLTPLSYNHAGLIVDLGVGLWAWPLPCDVDGDGDYDLMVSCPDKPSNGVWMFENTSGDTAKNKFPIFEPGKRIGKTVKYLMPSYVQGKMRVLSPGVEHTNFLEAGVEPQVALPIKANFHKPLGTQPKGPKMRHNQWRYVDYDGDEVVDLSVAVEDWSYYGWDDAWDSNGKWQNGPLHGWIYIFHNRGTNEKPQYDEPVFIEAEGKRLDVFGCPSPNFADFDGDGDLDLICGEFLDKFTYFENKGSRSKPEYAAGKRLKNHKGTELAMDLEMIVPIAFDWDKDGDLDLVVGDEDGRVALVENVGLQDNAPLFSEPKYFQQKADTLKCGALASPVGFDWDGDGDTDIVSGNTAGYIEFFENLSGPNVSNPKWNHPVRLKANDQTFRVMAGENGSIQGPAEAKWGYTTLNVADWDHDGLPDIVYNSILGRVEWLKNIGTRTKPKLAAPQSIEVEWENQQPILSWGWLRPDGKKLLTQWRTTPLVFDFNDDGLMDLAMLDQEGYLAFFERAKRDNTLIVKSPKRAFVDEQEKPLQLNPGTAGKSGRRKLCVTDWDGDGKFDLLLNSSNADLWKQVERREGRWIMKSNGTLAKKNIEGHDVSPTVVDFDGDSVPDFLGGAEDGRLYFMKNPRKSKALSIADHEFIYEEAPFPSCHASTIVESNNGTLISAWFGGTAEKNPDVGIWVSRKIDGKWTAPHEVANGLIHLEPNSQVTRYPTWNPVLFQPVHPDRRLPLMLFYKVGPSPQTWWGMLITSQDDGKTWSEPRRLPDGILGPIRNKPVQLANGSILSPSSTESNDKASKWQVHFEKSDDFGMTWRKVGPLNDGVEVQAIQPAILSIGKHRWQALYRTKQNKIYSSTSDDDGDSWSQIQPIEIPNNNSGLDAVTLRDGRHLLVYNHTSGTPGKWSGKRTPLNLSVSVDGKNWQGALVLESDPGEYSYPAIIQTRDGLIHITYTWKRQRIRHWTIDPHKIDGKPIVHGEWPRNL